MNRTPPVARQPRRPRRYAPAALVLAALLGVAVWLFVHWPSAATPGAQSAVVPLRVLVAGFVDVPRAKGLGAFLASHQAGYLKLPPVQTDLLPYRTIEQFRADLRRMRPEIGRYAAIYSSSQMIARLAQVEFANVPIVFAGVDNPVEICLVDSLQRPGRNATGYMHLLEESELRQMQLLKDAFPGLREVIVALSADNERATSCRDDDPRWYDFDMSTCHSSVHEADDFVERLIESRRLRDFGQALGLEVRFVVLCTPADYGRLAELTASRPDSGILVPWHSLFSDQPELVVRAAAAAGRPAVYPNHRFTDAGGLLSLEPEGRTGDDDESYRQLARVLLGKSPAELPVYRPPGYSVVVNVSTAQAQRLRPSLAVLRRADRLLP